jgi:uncharacterized protein (DUF1330 family)
MPKGYIIGEIHVTNPGAEYEEYRAKVVATIEAFGGRYLARGGDPTLLEGDAPLGRTVILEFESPERAKEWYNSPEYQAVLPLRLRNTKSRLTCASGI